MGLARLPPGSTLIVDHASCGTEDPLSSSVFEKAYRRGITPRIGGSKLSDGRICRALQRRYSSAVRKFQVSIWQEENLYVAQCLDVDVASQGTTEQEALDSVAEALDLHFTPPVATI